MAKMKGFLDRFDSNPAIIKNWSKIADYFFTQMQ